MHSFLVIIPAAGQSTRFGGGRNKLLEHLGGQTVLSRTIHAFMGRPDVSGIVLASPMAPQIWADGDREIEKRLHDGWLQICPGGDSRASSVRHALSAAPPDAEWVAVHDAARPLVSRELISSTFAASMKYGAAAPALPVTLTVKRADGPLPAPAQQTISRQSLWAMQTPQVMRRVDLQSAFDACKLPLEQVTDDAQLLELKGQDVWLIPGEERNLKITTALDLWLAERILESRR